MENNFSFDNYIFDNYTETKADLSGSTKSLFEKMVDKVAQMTLGQREKLLSQADLKG